MPNPLPALDRRILLALGAGAAWTLATLPAIGAASAANDPFIGKANAPVTMTLWFDFQCPYCKILWQGAIPKLDAAYVRRGKLRLVFSDFSFLGQDSVTAAVIGRAIWHMFPNAYFAWTNAMFSAQDRENSGFGDQTSVVKLTMGVPGIDGDRFLRDFNANVPAYVAEVRADYDTAKRAGITGTPALRIAGHMEEGAVPYPEIAAMLDAALARARQL